MLRTFLVTSVLILTSWLSPLVASAAEYTTAVNGAQYEIWLPDDVPTIYGVWWRIPESSGDTRGNLDRAQYRAFARSQSFAIIGMLLDDDKAATTSELQTVLNDFAAMSGHTELSNAVYLLEGYSLGGYRVTQLNDEIPGRVLCTITGGSSIIVQTPTATAATKIPTIYYRGSGEEAGVGTDRIAEVDAIRENHDYQAAAFIHWGFGHSRGDSLALAFQMWDACTTLRYPDDWDPGVQGLPTLLDVPMSYGWLADASSYGTGFTDIAEAQSYTSDPLQRHWLLNRDVAFAYRGFSSQDPAVHFVEPNSMTNFELVDPDEVVNFEVTVDAAFAATSVEFFDGSVSIGVDDSAPFTIQWQAERVGAHNIVAIARNSSNESATGLPLPIIVEGITIPGGGGLDTGDLPDAGSGNGGSDAGANDGGLDEDAGDNGGFGNGGGDPNSQQDDAGCGCNHAGNPFSSLAAAVTCCLLLLRRRRSTARNNTATN